ncbi:MAG: GyrI-like domain-containing protein [Blastocatellia bacterium]
MQYTLSRFIFVTLIWLATATGLLAQTPTATLSGYVARDAAPFEVYLNKKPTPPAELRTEIWIPIE